MLDASDLLENLLVVSRLKLNEREQVLDDDDLLPDLISRAGRTVVSYGWDSQMPGGSGASWISVWRSLYFVSSSDYPSEGPFETLEESFDSEAFAALGANLEFECVGVAVTRLLALVERSFVGDAADTIVVNGSRYLLRNGRFVRAPRLSPR